MLSRCCRSLLVVNKIPVRSFSTAEVTANPPKEHRRLGHKRLSNRPIVINQRARNAELEKKQAESKLPWRLVVSCILDRPPICKRPPLQWETDHFEVQFKIRRKGRKIFYNELKRIGGPLHYVDEELAHPRDILKTLPFTPAPLRGEDDLNDNRKSYERKWDESLFFIAKRNRENHPWQFPQGKLQPGENLAAAAERIIDRAVGQTDRWVSDNAPVGHYLYEYPPEVQAQRKQFGAKVFYMHALLLDEEFKVKLETKLYTDYVWMSRDTLLDYFDKDSAYYLKHLLPNYDFDSDETNPFNQ